MPVLSVQMQDVEPKVSTPSKFFTKTYFFYSFCAVIANATVAVLRSPSGTLATKIPIQKIIPSNQLTLTTKIANNKKSTPKNIAIPVI